MLRRLNTHMVVFLLLLASLSSTCVVKKSNRDIRRTGQEEGASSCGNDGMAARRSAVFARTASCAATATGLGLADMLQKAALAVGELKAFAAAIKSFNQTYGTAHKMELNVAKATLCSKIFVGEYVHGKTMITIADQLRKAGTGEAIDLQPIEDLGANIVVVGGLDLYIALKNAVNQPNIENTLKLAAVGTGSFTDLYQLALACGPIFTEIGSAATLSTAQIGKMTGAMAKVGVYAAIADCTAAGLFNAIDVGTEWSCLQKDLEVIRTQNQAILAGEQAQCRKLGQLAELPTSVPILKNKMNDKDSKTGELTEATQIRASICQRTIYSWGNCLATSRIDDRSKATCEKLCDGRSNIVRNTFNEVTEQHNLDQLKTYELVTNFNEFCISSGNPSQLINDGITPCVNACIQGGTH